MLVLSRGSLGDLRLVLQGCLAWAWTEMASRQDATLNLKNVTLI